jgi:uncharacterized membrane protein HdeD (DUF308 family)
MNRSSSAPRPNHAASFWIFMVCGVWLVGLGVYFVLLRPALLPEDPRFMGSTLPQIRAALPGLELWLGHVFTVMGGFMAASGLLTMYVAGIAVQSRRQGTGVILLLTGLATVVNMSWTNFAIDSNFRWVLLAPALLWLIGLVCYVLERRR